ncbi:unnamed protein product [Prorocentrum cordatum]|uniref:Uncharacterized protein n=1 Tax=Prorocentrum cordatum TaxID=2364126 RepID=A0ABN9WPL2_9DINO|nr:unnamed protein product [Polarella glacialis]
MWHHGHDVSKKQRATNITQSSAPDLGPVLVLLAELADLARIWLSCGHDGADDVHDGESDLQGTAYGCTCSCGFYGFATSAYDGLEERLEQRQAQQDTPGEFDTEAT